MLLAACTKAGGTHGASGGAVQRNPTTIPHLLRIGDWQDITTLNPHLGSATSLENIAALTMAYLLRADERNRPVPELATAVPTQANGGISPDGRAITWHLRHNVTWSDGAPFNADDVVFSTHVVLNPANNEISHDGWNLITRIDEPDKYTVVFHLRRPYADYFPTFFGTGGANPCILPKHLLARFPNINAAAYNARPIGIGPFRITEWVRGDHVAMQANPRYWRGTPKLNKIVYRFVPDRDTLLTQLRTGEIDVWPFVGPAYYERVNALPNVRVLKDAGYYYQHLDFNLMRPMFRDPAVRQAIRLAVDRQAIVHTVNHGIGIVQEWIETPASPIYTTLPLAPFDIARANALLERAGWKRGTDGVRAKDGIRLDVQLAFPAGNPDYDQLVEVLRASWQQIGVAVNARPYAPALFYAPYESGGILYRGRYDMIYFAWGLDPTVIPAPLFACAETPPNGENTNHYCNKKTDELLGRMSETYDEAQRRRLAADIARIIDADVPTIVMYIRDGMFAYNTDVTGWHPNQISPFDDMMNVDV
jgi:peptide/nickel transport system substrate-binding protein